MFTKNGVPAGRQHPESIEFDDGAVLEPRRQTNAEPITKSSYIYIRLSEFTLHLCDFLYKSARATCPGIDENNIYIR